MSSSIQATRRITGSGRNHPEFNGRVLEILELQSVRAAMKLAENVMAWSRTAKAGEIRMLAIQYILFGEPSVDQIAFRMGVKRRRVFYVIREVRCVIASRCWNLSVAGRCENAPRRAIVKYAYLGTF
jgi:hypothetical protein